MVLDLNETVQPYRDFYTDKTPRYVDQMPLLISGKNSNGEVVDVPRKPVEVETIFERRLNSSKPDWMNNWFYTGTGLLVPSRDSWDGRFKIRRKSESLREVDPKTTFVCGGIPYGSYENASGVEFISGEDGVIVDREMTKDEALNNPALLEALGGNTGFRDAVVDRIFYEGSREFNYNTMMGIYLPSGLEQAHERAFYVNWLGDWSRLGGRGNLVNFDSRLVGYLASETQK